MSNYTGGTVLQACTCTCVHQTSSNPHYLGRRSIQHWWLTVCLTSRSDECAVSKHRQFKCVGVTRDHRIKKRQFKCHPWPRSKHLINERKNIGSSDSDQTIQYDSPPIAVAFVLKSNLVFIPRWFVTLWLIRRGYQYKLRLRVGLGQRHEKSIGAGMYYLLVNLPLLLGHQGKVNFFLRELDVCVVAV